VSHQETGRTKTLADKVGRQALRCIRCSACLNVCPVYERTGGQAYGSVYPGPIGAILTPQLGAGTDDPETAALLKSLPFASSLCGACYEVCPVRIDIPQVLVHLRGKAVASAHTPESVAMAAAGWVMASPTRYRLAQRAATALRLLARRGQIKRLPWPGSRWTDARDLPAPAKETFSAWWRRTHG